MKEKQTCACQGNRPKKVFACSGAADLGRISDLGYVKGETPVTAKVIDQITEKAVMM